MPFELQRKQDQNPFVAESPDMQQGNSRDAMRALAAGGFDAQQAALAPVQLDGGKAGLDPARVQQQAAAGIASGGGKMPHLAAIQQSFGKHDVGAVQAHTGGDAAAACEGMGAAAYASGNAVAFKGAPDLHTAAHEAAHIVQQRAGVSLAGGVGKAGDNYEKHADQVADAVVQGKSAEGLLDKQTGGGAKAAAGPVQQKSVQLKPNALKNFFTGGAKTVKTIVPMKDKNEVGGELWDSSATGSKTLRNDSKSKDERIKKLKIWGERIGVGLGLLLAPTVTVISSFGIGGIVSAIKKRKQAKKNKKNNKKPQQTNEQISNELSMDPHALLRDRIKVASNTPLLKGMTRSDRDEPLLTPDDVRGMLEHRLGLGTPAPNLDKEQMIGYQSIEEAICSSNRTIAKAFETQNLLNLPKNDGGDEQEENQDEDKVIGNEGGMDVTEIHQDNKKVSGNATFGS